MESQKPTLGKSLDETQCKVAGLPGAAGLAVRQLEVAHAVLLSGLSIAAALVFLALAGRYEFVVSDAWAARFDRLTGSAELCTAQMREERGADGGFVAAFSQIECAPEVKQ